MVLPMIKGFLRGHPKGPSELQVPKSSLADFSMAVSSDLVCCDEVPFLWLG